jgi:hypothetical protein
MHELPTTTTTTPVRDDDDDDDDDDAERNGENIYRRVSPVAVHDGTSRERP